jgi:drug/metabolite transporter (DMT)-like permease
VQNAVFIVLIGLGWGLLGPASKALFAAEPGTFDGITVAVARAAWALPLCVIALGVAWRIEPPRLDARRWLAVVIAAVLFGPFITVIFSVAAQHTSVAHISFLFGLSPVTNTALAALVFRTALDRRAVVALVLGIAGVALLAATHSSDKSAFVGDLLMVFWLIAFAVYACFLRYVGVRINAAMLMCLVGTIAMAALLVPGIALGYGGAIGHVADTSSIAWWFFAEVLLGSTLIAQPAYAAAVRRLGVALATIGAEYTALSVGIVASLVAHEPWTPLTVIGGLILCCALTVTFAPVPGLAAPLRRAA